jgi:hypothetical protein
MDIDFPAAHSADTEWFAVDKDGYVALFGSGEAGAVPSQACVVRSRDIPRQLSRAQPRSEPIQDFKGRFVPGPRPSGREHTFWHADWGLLLFLKSIDPVRPEIEAGRAAQVPSTEEVAVLCSSIPEQLFRRLHDEGLCLGCFWNFEDSGDEDWPNLARHGLYVYSHLTENWISGPYGRKELPPQPVHIDQLPPSVREALKQLRFDALAFAKTLHIQPVEHTPCDSWETSYLDVKGEKIGPIPGKEAEYRAAYEDLKRVSSFYQIEPPPAEPKEDE